MLPVVLIILLSLKYSLQECIIDHRTITNGWEQQLQRDLKTKPELFKMPCGPSGVEIHLRFTLKWFNFYSELGVFTIYSWVMLSWSNQNLTWNPSDYGGVNESLLSNHDMWYPKLQLMNGLDSEEQSHYFSEPCQVKSSGRVSCVYRVVDRVTCLSNLTKWPYDTQSCSVKFGVWDNKNNTVRLRTTGRVITMFGADYGSEWDIIDYKQEENQGAETQLTMTFVIERHAEILAAMLVYPSIVLSTLSIICFTLDVRRMIRFGLLCFNLANHFSFLMELQEHIPGHSFYTPKILFYYSSSMSINVFLVLFTHILSVMCKREKMPPFWVCSVNDIVFKGRGKRFVWPRWDSDGSTNGYAGQWTHFANIINNVLFIVIIIVFVCLYSVYMPQPPPLNY